MCAAKLFFYQISVPRAIKGWEPLAYREREKLQSAISERKKFSYQRNSDTFLPRLFVEKIVFGLIHIIPFARKSIGGTGVWTRDIPHAKRTLYHWAMPPDLCFNILYKFCIHIVLQIWTSLTWLKFVICNWFSLLPQLPQKMSLASKVVKID